MAKCTQIKGDLTPCYIKRRVHPEVYAYKRGEITKAQLKFIRHARRIGFDVGFGPMALTIEEMTSGRVYYRTEITIRKTLRRPVKLNA